MSISTWTINTLVKYFVKALAIVLFPITAPIAVGINYRGTADSLASLPGICRGGGPLSFLSVLTYLATLGGIITGAAMFGLNGGDGPEVATATDHRVENSTPVEVSTTTPGQKSNPDYNLASDSLTPLRKSIDASNNERNMESKKYDLLITNVEEMYPNVANNSYTSPYLNFLNGSYNQERQFVKLNFSIARLNSIDRYEVAVGRTAGIYVWSHFDSNTAYPEKVTVNYFRNGELNATTKIRPQWMRQYIFGNVSPDSAAPMSYRTYVRASIGALSVNSQKTEFPQLINRCNIQNTTKSVKCKNDLRNRMPVRYYLPEQTATGGPYTNIMGGAQPAGSFDNRQERLEHTTQKLEENITGAVSLDGDTAVDEDDVWKDVDMRIRDVSLENETIVVEQYTRSERGDDGLPLRQNDVIGAKYGRLVVNYGAKFMPADGVVIMKYTPDGERYAKFRVPNYNAVGYINGERGLVELGLDVEVVDRYQNPGS
jgi:hypothetical protein